MLVHGAGSARWGFDLVRPELEDAFTVIAVDRRGRGDSGDQPQHYALAREFGDVASPSSATPARERVLFGHSYGALVAAGAAALLPELPKLVLYEPPMGGVLAGEDWTGRFEERLDAGDRERGRSARSSRTSAATARPRSTRWRAPRPGPTAWRWHPLFRANCAPRESWRWRASSSSASTSHLMLLGTGSPAWARRSTRPTPRCCRVAEARPQGHGHGGHRRRSGLVASEMRGLLA